MASRRLGGLQIVALAMIRAYQRFLSPRKGFVCAYRVHRRHAAGCSALGYRAIRCQGLWRGLGLLRLRLSACGALHRRCQEQQALRRPLAGQRGDCDLGCDGGDLGGCKSCDASDGRIFSRLIDGCSCDWPTRRENKPKPRTKPRRRESVPWPEQRR